MRQTDRYVLTEAGARYLAKMEGVNMTEARTRRLVVMLTDSEWQRLRDLADSRFQGHVSNCVRSCLALGRTVFSEAGELPGPDDVIVTMTSGAKYRSEGHRRAEARKRERATK